MVDVESAPLEQIVKQLDKLVNVVEITELAPDEAVERELLLATVAADRPSARQVIELVGVFGGEVVDVGADRLTVMLAGPPEQGRRLRGTARPVRDRRAPAHRAGRAA